MNRELRAIAVEQHAVPALLYGVVAPIGIVSVLFAVPVAWSFIEAGSYWYGILWAFSSVAIAVISCGCIGRCRREWRMFKEARAAAHTASPKSGG